MSSKLRRFYFIPLMSIGKILGQKLLLSHFLRILNFKYSLTIHSISNGLRDRQNEEPRIVIIKDCFSITSSPQCCSSYSAHSDPSIDDLESPVHHDRIPFTSDVRHLWVYGTSLPPRWPYFSVEHAFAYPRGRHPCCVVYRESLSDGSSCCTSLQCRFCHG